MTNYFNFEEQKINNSFPLFFPYNCLYKVDEYNYQHNDFDYYKNVINSLNEKTDDSTTSENKSNDCSNDALDFTNTVMPKPIESQKVLFDLKKRKKPGAKIKNNEINNNKKPYIHTRNKFDNIATKIQVSYMNFLINFVNIILNTIKRSDLKFYLLDANYKKNNNTIEKRQRLKETSIGDIISTKISLKYTSLDEDANLKTYEKIKNYGLYHIIEILNQKFLFFFDKVYYSNLRTFNLKDFGLMDLEIKLPKDLELYENVIAKNNKNFKFEEYKEKMEQCVKKHFLGGLEEELLNS